MSPRADIAGTLVEVNGTVVRACCTRSVALGEVVRVGEDSLLGEAIALEGDQVVAQVYEDTSGLAPGAPFVATGEPLTVELGPGLLGTVYDGVQRPLARLAAAEGDLLGRGSHIEALDPDRRWDFTPQVKVGDVLEGGAILGTVPETGAIVHKVLLPPDLAGTVTFVVEAGAYPVTAKVVRLRTGTGDEVAVPMRQRWRVRRARPVAQRLEPGLPLITGQRVLDTFFPLPEGGAAGLPGGFGTGKTVLQHQLVKWADADVIVFVGCGERGNEMTRMLRELPGLTDPRTGGPLADRTVLVANTSNMPVSAREASIYTGVTLAEYYRDMGYRVAMLSDSTSRWAEALREISGRLEEMPAEEGYPPYLQSRLAAFYERAGRARTLAGDIGSVTLISAISPPGGDLTEPVTRHTQALTPTFWTLDKARAEARVFPALSITASYSKVPDALTDWWVSEVGPTWPGRRQQALSLLEAAARVERTARLIGAEGLPDRQRFLLRLAALFDEGFLRQNAYDPVDSYCAPSRQLALLELLLHFHDAGMAAIAAGASATDLSALPVVARIERARSTPTEDEAAAFAALTRQVDAGIASVVPGVGAPAAEPAPEAAGPIPAEVSP